MMIVSFLVGAFVGGCIGIVLMAVCSVGAYEKGYEDGRNYE